jgi:hypothetical protein
MRSAWGRGVREGPVSQNAEEISSQRSARREATWRRKKKEEGVGSGVMKKSRHQQSEHFLDKILISVIVFDIKDIKSN